MIASLLHLPLISGWSELRLQNTGPLPFSTLLFQRALAVGEDIYDPEAYTILERPPSEHQSALIHYLRRRAWGEWFFGVETPARQLLLLPAGATRLKMRLARQISDELRHYNAFASAVRERGGHVELDQFDPPVHLKEMLTTQVFSATPGQIAAANQFSGEIVLSVQGRREGNILRYLLEEDLADLLETLEKDEPSHIALGRALVSREAVDSESRRALALSQEKFLRALIGQHVSEIESLGCRRTRTVPKFQGD